MVKCSEDAFGPVLRDSGKDEGPFHEVAEPDLAGANGPFGSNHCHQWAVVDRKGAQRCSRFAALAPTGSRIHVDKGAVWPGARAS